MRENERKKIEQLLLTSLHFSEREQEKKSLLPKSFAAREDASSFLSVTSFFFLKTFLLGCSCEPYR